MPTLISTGTEAATKFITKKIAAYAPHFSASLQRADVSKQPLTAESRLSTENATMKNFLTKVSPVAEWAKDVGMSKVLMTAGATLGPVGMAAGAVAGQIISSADEKGTGIASRIKAMQNRFIIDTSEDATAASPANAPSVDASAASPDKDAEREKQLLILSAAITSAGYGGTLPKDADLGDLPVTVAEQVKEAADVIAPGKLPSQMTTDELNAISVSAIQASDKTFIDVAKNANGMTGSDVESRSITQAAKDAPGAGEFAGQLMEDGKLSPEKLQGMTSAFAPTPGGGDSAADMARKTLLATAMMKANLAAGVAKEAMGEASTESGGKFNISSLTAPVMNEVNKVRIALRNKMRPDGESSAPGEAPAAH